MNLILLGVKFLLAYLASGSVSMSLSCLFKVFFGFLRAGWLRGAMLIDVVEGEFQEML
jgi:hypothetical protein